MPTRVRPLRILRDAPPPRVVAAADPREQEWVAALRRGDGAAYETLVRRYGPRMLRVARRYAPEDADDVVQAAWIQVFRSIDRFAGASRLSTWLHRIVVNCALMRLRNRARHPEAPLAGTAVERARDEREVGLEDLARRETYETLHDALERLPERLRCAVVLCDVDGLTLREAGRLLGHTLAAVKTHVHRGHLALRAMLGVPPSSTAPS